MVVVVVVVRQLVSVSEFHAKRLRVPAADDVTSLVGHVVGAFSQHLSAQCDAYVTYLAGIDDAGDTVRQLMQTDATFAHYIEVKRTSYDFVYYFIATILTAAR